MSFWKDTANYEIMLAKKIKASAGNATGGARADLQIKQVFWVTLLLQTKQ